VQGLEDVEVVDGEPVAASLIPRAVTAGELLFDDGATQTFDVNGDTSYVEADGRPTQGKWYVDEDGRFCSVDTRRRLTVPRPRAARAGPPERNLVG
jgi:hypothetical protein